MSNIDPADLFPHPELTPIPTDTKPDYLSLKLIHQQLNANAMAVPSDLGGGSHGHLALVVPAAQYNAMPGTAAWVHPDHPGPNPVYPPTPTGPVIAATDRQYKHALENFKTNTATEAMLKRLLIAAVPDTYTKILKDENLGYANVTTLAILQHLDTNYGTVTADDLDENMKRLTAEWNPMQPIEDLWNQINEARRFAHAHDPISEAAAIRAALSNLEASGVFADGLKEWRKLAAANHTWNQLLTHFNAADKERRRNTTTSSEMGYANKAAFNKVEEEKKENKPPHHHNATMYYCWTHGYGPNSTHTSKTCSNPQTGHQTKATVDNMMGGCCVIKRRMGEKAIYRRPQRVMQPPTQPPTESKE